MDSLRQKLVGLINSTKRKKPYRCEVEYLESTEQQSDSSSTNAAAYIDTGIIPNNNTRLECRMQFTTLISGNSKEALNGTTSTGQETAPRFAWGFASLSPYTNFYFGLGAQNLTTSVTRDTNVHTFVLDAKNKTCSIDDTTNSFTSSGRVDSTRNIYLFARHATGDYANKPCNAKIYCCKIYDNETIVRDFIPVLDWNDKPAMYDKVTGQLFYTQGTKDFTYGREIHRVDYLESTENAKQWIDTEYIVNTATDEIELDFQFLSNTMYKWVFGDHYTSGRRLAIGSGDGEGKRNLAYGATTYKIADKYILNNPHHYNINSTGAYIDGDKLANYSSFTGDATLYLFNINIDSTSDYTSSGRIWRYKHKRNGVYLRDMYPAIDENGIGFMFDKVTHTIFDNKGTGIGFKYPPVEVEYLESTGTQYINTGLLSTANSKVDAEFSFTSMESGVANNCAVFGGRNQPNIGFNTFVLFKIASGNPQYFRFDYNSQQTVATAEQLTWNTNSKYRFQYDGAKCISTNLTTGENVITENEPASSFTQEPIYLFCVNSAGARGNAMAGRIYKYWYTDGTNTIKLVPAIKDGKGCMYDKITGTVYPNLGTDDFIVGKIKEK